MSDSEYKRADTLLGKMQPRARNLETQIPQFKNEDSCPRMVGKHPETLCGYSVKDVEEGKREKAVRCDGGRWRNCSVYKERSVDG